jgi:hypothetical protein
MAEESGHIETLWIKRAESKSRRRVCAGDRRRMVKVGDAIEWEDVIS